jgi:hypothetical protein
MEGVISTIQLLWAPGARALNVYTGQNPRQPVVLIEIQPNAYNNYLSQMAGINLHSLGWFIFVYWNSYLWHINFVHVNFVYISLLYIIYVHMFMYISTKMYHPRERIWRKENKQADRFVPICVNIVRIWLVSLRTTCRLGFCLVQYTHSTG